MGKVIRYFKSICFLFIVFGVVLSCGKSTFYTKYYLIDYIPHKQDILSDKNPWPFRVMVQDLDISPLYDSSKIIVRKSMHQIQYSSDSLWPLRPQYAIRDILIKHLRIEGLFQEVDKEFLNARPDYIIKGTIYAIEFYSNQDLKMNKANIEVKYTLEQYRTGNVILTHFFRRSDKIGDFKMIFFVKKISDILNEENQKFIKKIEKSFARDVKAKRK